ncbi:hypothetical protein Ccrd_021013 [Cynara cardunculus var. scolymus]|uniref:Uncharacterized protein n=1 Tax=Cynara cardunculus var. scolymus TaxID=59895 RepID=A0A118K0G5_CYNCS|nr:hypothetical protein Ccrd_021013 [Cynara cardunculus var. scolymus]
MVMSPMTFQAVMDAAKMTEKEKNLQYGERGNEKRKWDEPPNDLRRPKFTRKDAVRSAAAHCSALEFKF